MSRVFELWRPSRAVQAGTCGACGYVQRDDAAMFRGTRSTFACGASPGTRIVKVKQPPPSWCPGPVWSTSRKIAGGRTDEERWQ